MTTHSQQQQMAQPAELRAQGSVGVTSTQAGAADAATGGGQGTRGFFGGACGAGAGAAILWQPITVQGTGRR